MSTSPIKCSICGTEFTLKKNLYGHMRKIHQLELLYITPPRTFHCKFCDKSFSHQSSLTRHVRELHVGDYTGKCKKTRLICPYETCTEEVTYYENLRQHLAVEHNIEVQCENLIFHSMKDFETWKNEIEQKTISFYTKDTGKKVLKNGVNKIFFNCHRSYDYKKKGNNIRATKSMGSNKIGKACPSRIEFTIIKDENEKSMLLIKYWKTHCGHTQQIRRLPLNKDAKLKIAGKLQEGVTFDEMLDTIRNSDDSDISPRLLLLERKDLHNIVRDYNASKKLNNNDAINDNLVTKTELLLDLINSVQMSDKHSKIIEKKLDSLIELIQREAENYSD